MSFPRKLSIEFNSSEDLKIKADMLHHIYKAKFLDGKNELEQRGIPFTTFGEYGLIIDTNSLPPDSDIKNLCHPFWKTDIIDKIHEILKVKEVE